MGVIYLPYCMFAEKQPPRDDQERSAVVFQRRRFWCYKTVGKARRVGVAALSGMKKYLFREKKKTVADSSA